jgi:hypothetical protein
VAVAPGLGFGEYGEGFVRIGLVENEHRIRQAARNVKKFIQEVKVFYFLLVAKIALNNSMHCIKRTY